MSIRHVLGRIKRTILGRDTFSLIESRKPMVRLGSVYGGWEIWPEPLHKDSIVYCAGLGTDATFDMAMIERFGVNVEVFDPTPDLDQWVSAQNFPPQFHFFPVGFAAEDTELVMRPQNADGSGSKTILGKDELAIDSTGVSVPVRRIGTLMQERGHDHIDLLKMDIEGAEYAVIDDIVDSKLNIKQLMIEFHVYVTDGVARKRKALDRLKSAGFKITAISRSGCEYSFVKE